ncbi:MAG: hypothetical protein ABIG43_06840, partial [Chloroflexota bacterium]
MSKNDDAWDMFFNHTNTLNEINKSQYAFVKADALKKIGQREPRLMTKIDTLEVRPEIFKDKHLSILPVKNGEYLIFKDRDQRSYYCFDNFLEKIPIRLHKPICNLDDFDSYPGEERMNEAQAIDFAFISSIIKTFTEETKMWLTIRGRQFTGCFSFIIPSIKKEIEIKSVQIEIDAGYESQNKIYLFEAKIGRRSNFNIRQLYYPYLEWKQRSEKEIIPILFFNTNGLNYLFQFQFGETFNDIQLSKYACFSLDETLVTHAKLKSVLANSAYKENEPIEYPFPQADDMDKVIDTISLISQGYDDKTQISEELEFDERQGDYYGNAGCYLGFLEHEDGKVDDE